MHSAGEATATDRTTSLRALLRHVRAARRGRPSSLPATDPVSPPFAGYVALGLGDLCDELHRHLESVPGLTGAERDLVRRYFGLTAPPVPLAEAATGLVSARGQRLGLRQVHNRLSRAIDAFARHLPPPDGDGGGPARVEPPRWPGLGELRSRLCDVHYAGQLRRALAATGAAAPAPAADGSSALRPRLPLGTALAQLAADAFGDPPPTGDDGAPVPPWLRWRLRALAWTTVVAACPSLAVRPPGAAPRGDRIEDDGDGLRPPLEAAPAATAGALAGDADPAAVAAMLDAAQQALQAVDGVTARTWLTLAGEAIPRDAGYDGGSWGPMRAATLRLWVAAESHVGALRTFDRFRELELLAGPGPDTCLAAFDVSFMLSAFGHIDEALDLLHRQRAALDLLEPAQAAFFRSWVRLRAAIVLQKRAAARNSGDDLATARRIVARAGDGADLPEFERHELGRTAATIDISSGELARAERRRGVDAAFDRAAAVLRRPPPSVTAYDPVRGSIPGTYRTDVRWAMASMSLALYTDDASAFAYAATVGLRHWNARPNAPIVGLALRRLVLRGREHFQLDLPAVARPAPFTGWDAAFRPSPRILVPVGGRSWVCPSTVTRP